LNHGRRPWRKTCAGWSSASRAAANRADYLLRDAEGSHSSNAASRRVCAAAVRSYFRGLPRVSPRISLMVRQICRSSYRHRQRSRGGRWDLIVKGPTGRTSTCCSRTTRKYPYLCITGAKPLPAHFSYPAAAAWQPLEPLLRPSWMWPVAPHPDFVNGFRCAKKAPAPFYRERTC